MPKKTVAPLGRVDQPQKSQVQQLAEHLGVSRQHVNRLLLAGRIPGAYRASDGRWILGLIHAIKAGKRGPRASYRGVNHA